jgi:hypothetical protein
LICARIRGWKHRMYGSRGIADCRAADEHYPSRASRIV